MLKLLVVGENNKIGVEYSWQRKIHSISVVYRPLCGNTHGSKMARRKKSINGSLFCFLCLRKSDLHLLLFLKHRLIRTKLYEKVKAICEESNSEKKRRKIVYLVYTKFLLKKWNRTKGAENLERVPYKYRVCSFSSQNEHCELFSHNHEATRCCSQWKIHKEILLS